MLSRIHSKLGTAGLVVAIVALVAALGGAAFAAVPGLNSKQKKEVKKIAKSFQGKGPTGPAGPAGAAGAPGKEGAAGPKGATGGEGKQGPEGKQGKTGNPGEPGATGATGPTGPKGATGSSGCGGVLCSKESEFGRWGYGFTPPDQGRVFTPVSYPIQMPSVPTFHFVKKSETGVTGCPGTAAAPAAEPGNLCVYESASGTFLDEATVSSTDANKFGVMLNFQMKPVEEFEIEGHFFETYQQSTDFGTWAATAP